VVKVDDEKRFKMEFALSSEQQEREGMNDDGAGVSSTSVTKKSRDFKHRPLLSQTIRGFRLSGGVEVSTVPRN
jgi:hypothetical protein